MTEMDEWEFITPEEVKELYLGVKRLFLTVMALNHYGRAITYYPVPSLKQRRALIDELTQKLNKLDEFANLVSEKLLDALVEMDNKQAELRANLYPKKEKHGRRQIARDDDRPTRPTEGRQDTTRKSFSIADAMARNRSGS